MGRKSDKVLFIYDSISYLKPFFIEKGFQTYKTYREVGFFQRVLRRGWFLLKLPHDIWFDGWKHELKNVSTVIVFASKYASSLEYIQSKAPGTRVIFWYWNPVFQTIDPKSIPDGLCEKWSFDESDCEKYGMKFNTQFYLDNIALPEINPCYDVVFLGADKGRRPHLDEIERSLQVAGLQSYFYIVDDEAYNVSYTGKFPLKDYSFYIELVSKSKAILDYVQEGQRGLTLRPLECLFHRKKLITNDPSIKSRDFYNKDNIFVLGSDDMSKVKEFLDSPFVRLPSDIENKYDVESWVNRFSVKDA